MHFELGLPPWAEQPRLSHPANSHRVSLVPVAHQRESPVLNAFYEPRITLRQCDGATTFGEPPLQAQARECLFQSMDAIEHAAIVANKRRRVDDDSQGFTPSHRSHPVKTRV